ncbi:MAG: LPS export ABC transporter permease LptG [Deltaproteobacteria bacterium]|nr:LPS export ABC transporter permease LptG [Deltaproteobacteria bacterium]
MRILSRYLTIEFFKLLLLCLITFVSIYLIIDFLQKIDNFFEAQASKSVMMSYFLHKAPFIIVQMLPPASLISAVIMFCLMKKNNEINAVKACGLNIFRLSQPVIMASLLIGIAIFLFSEIIVPYASSRSNKIWNIEVEKQDPTRFYGSNQIWYKGSDSIYWMMRFDNEKKIMERPTFYFFDKAFRLIKRIDGRRGFWENGKWRIENGVIQEARKDGGYEFEKFMELYLQIPETPETFVRAVKRPEEMSYWELKRYTKKVRQEGYDETGYLVDMNVKVAYPFISLIFVLIGIPIALGVKKGGMPLAVSIGMGICFLYMFTLGLSRSLGLSGVLPPVLAAWLANLIFFFLGVYLMLHVER